MTDVRAQEQVVKQRWAPVLMVFCSLSLICPGIVEAKKLEDVIPGLFGGDGVQTSSAVVGGSISAGEFSVNSLSELNQLTNGIISQLGRFSVNSTVAAFGFDPEREYPFKPEEALVPCLGNGPIHWEKDVLISR